MPNLPAVKHAIGNGEDRERKFKVVTWKPSGSLPIDSSAPAFLLHPNRGYLCVPSHWLVAWARKPLGTGWALASESGPDGAERTSLRLIDFPEGEHLSAVLSTESGNPISEGGKQPHRVAVPAPLLQRQPGVQFVARGSFSQGR